MDIRVKFKKRIERKEKEIAELEAKISSAKVYIQALQDSMKDLPKNGVTGLKKPNLRVGSMCHKAYILLKARQIPMHIKDILEGIGLEFPKDRASLRGSMGPYLRDGQIFKPMGTATFGLVELEYDEQPKKKTMAERTKEVAKEASQEDEPEETFTDIEPF